MPYQYKREPLSNKEANRLANAAESFQDKLAVFTLLYTGLRVSDISEPKKDNIQRQERRLIICGKKTNVESFQWCIGSGKFWSTTSPLKALLEYRPGRSQRIVKWAANKASIAKPVSPHVLWHMFGVSCIKKGISKGINVAFGTRPTNDHRIILESFARRLYKRFWG